MKKILLTALLATATVTLMTSAADAATVTDDGFGGSYFTAQAPDALGDTPVGSALASKSTLDNDEAESVSKIEPAAGGSDDFGVFTLPEDPSAPLAAQSGQVLSSPTTPIVPGQTVDKSAK
ncbi:MAG: hypothetical protein JWO78_1429 [Micavibrio sp.]|nr:hypothetical protein [Micavibrio sp.]